MFVNNKISFVRVAAVLFIGLMGIAVLLPGISFSNQTRGPVGNRRLTGRTTGSASKSATESGQNKITESGLQQIAVLEAEKAARTPAQRKVSSQLLQAVRESRGESMPAGIQLQHVNVYADADGRLLVDVTGNINDTLVFKIQQLGGEIINSSSEYGGMRARINLMDVDTISGFPEVKFVRPAVRAITSHSLGNASLQTGEANRQSVLYGPFNARLAANNESTRVTTREQRAIKVRNEIQSYLARSGAEPNSTGSPITEGDRTHRADDARSAFGYSGAGIKIGVLSDSYNWLGGAAADVASGNLPGVGNPFGHNISVTVLEDSAFGSDEGRAMLQIVHDIAPKAQLFFATADNGEFSFADNIKKLRTNFNCDIIIDDVEYEDEPPFQDGLIAQAVNTVTAAGALYFSAAGNDGSLSKGTSGVWEGDFRDAGSNPAVSDFSGPGTIHNFGTVDAPVLGNTILAEGFDYVLNWSDALGQSNNDYDLFIMDDSLTSVLAFSNDSQSGFQDPFEQISGSGFVGKKLVIFKVSGAADRALHLSTLGGRLSMSTTGSSFGHSCAQDAFNVAATPAGEPFRPVTLTGPFPNAFSTSNQVEDYSSDGPRRIFFNGDGTAITPGNFLFGTNGGTARNKPDITAADGVSTTFAANTGLNPFYGTSAAAPHAGAIAALIKSAKPSLTNAQIRTILISTALDIESPGIDNISGFGILQAFQAMQSVAPSPVSDVEIGSVTATEGSFKNDNGSIDPGEIANLTIVLNNPTLNDATNVTAVLSTTTTGITILSGNANYGTIAAGGNATNANAPFRFAVDRFINCGTIINFVLNVSFGGGVSPVNLNFPITVGGKIPVINSTLGSTPPAGAGFVSGSGTQTGVLNRDFVSSICGVLVKGAPSLVTGRSVHFDSYTFANSATASQCVTVTLTNISQIGTLYSAAYKSSGYVPSNPQTNYLADSGNLSTTQTYSFASLANQPFTIVVHEYFPGDAIGANYSLNVNLSTCAAGPACTPVGITNSDIATGLLSSPYSQSFTATGGSGIYNFSQQGTLPSGLTFSGNTISGTPTQVGSFPITINATDPLGCPAGSKSFTLIITANSINATSGTPQTTPIGHKFTTVLEATVLDPSSQPINGTTVTFTVVPNAGASATFSGDTTVVTATTNANGKAFTTTLTANNTAGDFTVTATVTGALSPATFALSNLFYKSGDINADGKVNVLDLLVMANFLAGNKHFSPAEKAAADVLDDHKEIVNVQDLLTLANFLAGNINRLPIVDGSNSGQSVPELETLHFQQRPFPIGLTSDGRILYGGE